MSPTNVAAKMTAVMTLRRNWMDSATEPALEHPFSRHFSGVSRPLPSRSANLRQRLPL